MFIFEELFDLNDDWYLGDKHTYTEKLSNKLLKGLSNVHIVGIQYLFENYVKERGGAILNEDEDLNMPLQVCAFLSSVKERINEQSPVLIISSESSLCKWHYHASEVGFKPYIITSENFHHSSVYILRSNSLKLALNLLDWNLFCVVMDDFDTLAAKLLVKKLRGSFNIGLTKRNFYKQPDQKLKWLMLNWASPGCVGKLNDFYRIDHLHSLALSDNYRFWWIRLTWKFCDSFETPNEEDVKEYQQKLQEWGELHNIKISYTTKSNLKRTKDKKQPTKKRKKINEEENADDTLNFPDSSFSIPSSPDEEGTELQNFIHDSKKLQVIGEENNSSDTSLAKRVKTEPNNLTKEIESDEETSSDFTKNFKEDESIKKNKNLDPSYLNIKKQIKVEATEDIASNEDEPILSIIYSQTPLKADSSLTKNSSIASESSENDSKFLSFLDMETSNKSQTYQQISDVLKNLSDVEDNTETNSDDDSFFSELITGKK